MLGKGGVPIDVRIEANARATISQKEQVFFMSRDGWTFLYWADIPVTMAVMESSQGETAYVYPKGDVSIRNRPTAVRDLRSLYYRRTWREGLKGLFSGESRRMKGGHAEKTAPRGSIVSRIVEKISAEYLLMSGL